MNEDICNPIPDCSYHNEGDGLCNHETNITPECHVACCPRLNKKIARAMYPDLYTEEVSLNMGDMCVSASEVMLNIGAGKNYGKKKRNSALTEY